MSTTTKKTAGTGPVRRGGPPLPAIAAAVIAVLAVVAILLTSGSSDGGGTDLTGSPTVSGDPLAALPADNDPAVGMPAPQVDGASFGGDPVSITPGDGTPKVIVFLAHWCPHCQREVPAIEAWLDEHGTPEGVELYSVVTSIDPARPNYPPDDWLRREDWSIPILVDDAGESIATAYGLSAFPFWVFVNADGTVAGRTSGQLPSEALSRIVAELTGRSVSHR